MSKIFITGLVSLFVGFSAYAEMPFSKAAFQNSQKNGEKVLLVFFADWCPTCQAQKKSLSKIEKDGGLRDITTYTVVYDDEVALKKELKVTHQSTLVSFLGDKETGRITGITSVEDINKYLRDTFSKNLKSK